MPTETATIPFDNSYARLPDRFYARLDPTPVAAPRLLKLNRPLAEILGLDPEALEAPEGVAMLAGNSVPAGAEPIALAYAGHQFGSFVPQLGDGRAILVGEVVGRDGVRRDIQLKGSGRTPFSRMGDGRAALGPVLREYVVSEAMAALGIPTTRSLAAVATGEPVLRERVLPGAVLTRVAHSHVRVGTFQYFAARGDTEALKALADHVIARHYPEVAGADKPIKALIGAVVARQAGLVSRWMQVGFIHGVMNTDNTSIAGETIDYGPCAFMDTYHPETVYSSIDHTGRYAYGNQPRIAHWNLACLAQALLPVMGEDEEAAIADAQEAVNGYPEAFAAAHRAGFCAKIGIADPGEEDEGLVTDLLDRMAANHADFTLTFRGLAEAATDPSADARVGALFDDPSAFAGWAARWRARLSEAGRPPAEAAAAMRATNPAVIPRNHLVEEAIAAAVDRDDLAPFEALVEALSRPFADRPEGERVTLPPRPEEVVRATFCGT